MPNQYVSSGVTSTVAYGATTTGVVVLGGGELNVLSGKNVGED